MKTIALTQGFHAIVDDDDFEELSCFKWHATRSKQNYYARRGIWNGHKMFMVSMHRIIMKANPGQVIDHRDGDTFNNQKSNLRFCTYSQNNANKIPKRNGSSKYKGVYWHKRSKVWGANIGVDHKQKNLGYYSSEKDAAEAYNKEALNIYGDFARLNTIIY